MPDGGTTLRRFKAEVFQSLGHPTRIHIIEVLRDGEQPVSTILERVGVEPANLSQHLSLMRSKGLVVKRRVGSQVLYSLQDSMLSEVLEVMRRYFQLRMEDVVSLLREDAEEAS